MQPLTKQELQTAIHQLRDSITGQAATKQDIAGAVNTITQKICSPGEMQRAMDASRERFIDRLGQPLRAQQAATQQIISQLDIISRRLSAIEARLGTMHGSLNKVHTDTETVAQRTEPGKRTMLSQMFT